MEVTAIRVADFPLEKLSRYDAIVIGTYTWGDGDIPDEMRHLYNEFEVQAVKNVVTGVVGTGDQFYPNFCGAVDKFRDMLYVQTQLAVTLKIELTPQLQDLKRCKKFVDSLIKRLSPVEI
jgi:flavodoxin I